MLPDERDFGYRWDIREAAIEVLSFTAGKSYRDFTSDRQLRLAVERNLEIIGEAARLVSNGFRASHPEISWQDMVRQRNVLAHLYGTDIDLRLLWSVIVEDLPSLISHKTR